LYPQNRPCPQRHVTCAFFPFVYVQQNAAILLRVLCARRLAVQQGG